MVDLLQTLGIGYLVLMLYLTFLYYKRNQYTLRNFIFWAVVWGVGIILLIIPETTSLITQRLNVARVLDFYLVLGIMGFSVICFLAYARVKKVENKVEGLVRKLALEKKK